MAKGRRRPSTTDSGTSRIPPAAALPDAVERIISRRQFQIETGDVVIERERTPRLSPNTLTLTPWRYRVFIFGHESVVTFISFQHAASEAEHMAAGRNARVVYVEDEMATLLADYRR